MPKNCKVRGLESRRVSGKENSLQVENVNSSPGILDFFFDRPGQDMQQDSSVSSNVCLSNS